MSESLKFSSTVAELILEGDEPLSSGGTEVRGTENEARGECVRGDESRLLLQVEDHGQFVRDRDASQAIVLEIIETAETGNSHIHQWGTEN